MSEDMIPEKPAQRSYALMKVAELKEELRSRNLKISGLSSELKARLRSDDRRKKKKKNISSKAPIGPPPRAALPPTNLTTEQKTTVLPKTPMKRRFDHDELMSSLQEERMNLKRRTEETTDQLKARVRNVTISTTKIPILMRRTGVKTRGRGGKEAGVTRSK